MPAYKPIYGLSPQRSAVTARRSSLPLNKYEGYKPLYSKYSLPTGTALDQEEIEEPDKRVAEDLYAPSGASSMDSTEGIVTGTADPTNTFLSDMGFTSKGGWRGFAQNLNAGLTLASNVLSPNPLGFVAQYLAGKAFGSKGKSGIDALRGDEESYEPVSDLADIGLGGGGGDEGGYSGAWGDQGGSGLAGLGYAAGMGFGDYGAAGSDTGDYGGGEGDW